MVPKGRHQSHIHNPNSFDLNEKTDASPVATPKKHKAKKDKKPRNSTRPVVNREELSHISEDKFKKAKKLLGATHHKDKSSPQPTSRVAVKKKIKTEGRKKEKEKDMDRN